MKKRILLVFLAAAMVLPMAACSPAGTQNSSSQQESSAASSTREDSSVGKPTEAARENPTEKKGLSAEKEGDDIKITIPAVLFNGNATSELTDEQKNNGFTSAKINDDGSVTYTMKQSSYEPFIKEYKKAMAQAIEQMISMGTYKSLKSVEYTDDFGKITIKADKKAYESNQLDSYAGAAAGLLGAMYQAFDVDIETPSCTVSIVDQESGKELDTATYPEAIE